MFTGELILHPHPPIVLPLTLTALRDTQSQLNQLCPRQGFIYHPFFHSLYLLPGDIHGTHREPRYVSLLISRRRRCHAEHLVIRTGKVGFKCQLKATLSQISRHHQPPEKQLEWEFLSTSPSICPTICNSVLCPTGTSPV